MVDHAESAEELLNPRSWLRSSNSLEFKVRRWSERALIEVKKRFSGSMRQQLPRGRIDIPDIFRRTKIIRANSGRAKKKRDQRCADKPHISLTQDRARLCQEAG